jgi:hypothetical protein
MIPTTTRNPSRNPSRGRRIPSWSPPPDPEDDDEESEDDEPEPEPDPDAELDERSELLFVARESLR